PVPVACGWIGYAIDAGVLPALAADTGYPAAAYYVAAATAPAALVVAVQHSGTVRYYSGRATVRYDWLDRRGLDDAISAMRAMNRGPLLVLDDWEESQFRARFAGQRWGALDWPARVEFASQPAVRVYDPFDRDRFEAHEPLHTIRVPMPR